MEDIEVECTITQVGIDISYMPKMDDRYHLLVIALENLSGWTAAHPPKYGTLEKRANIFDKKVISQFGTPEHVVLDTGAESKKWTDLLLRHYNIQTITGTP